MEKPLFSFNQTYSFLSELKCDIKATLEVTPARLRVLYTSCEWKSFMPNSHICYADKLKFNEIRLVLQAASAVFVVRYPITVISSLKAADIRAAQK